MLYKSKRFGEEFGEGVWHIKKNGYSKIAGPTDTFDPAIYAKMAPDLDTLASFLSAKTKQYFSESVQFTVNGGMKYQLPSSFNMAEDILRFLSLSEKDKQKEIRVVQSKNIHVDAEGNIRDHTGNVVFTRHSKEAIAVKIEELKKDLDYCERMLGEKCADSL